MGFTKMKLFSILMVVLSASLITITIFIWGAMIALSMFSGGSAALTPQLFGLFVILVLPILFVIVSYTIFREKKRVQLVLHIIGTVVLLIYFGLIVALFVKIRSENSYSNSIELRRPYNEFFDNTGDTE